MANLLPCRRRHSLLPGDAQVLDMVPDNPGNWLFHCHVRPDQALQTIFPWQRRLERQCIFTRV